MLRQLYSGPNPKEPQPVQIFRFIALIVLVVPPILVAQSATPEANAIRSVLDKQVVDWNRGDMEAFAAGYKNSPDILFIGSRISRGYAQMLDTYRKNYSTKEKMGMLNFSELEVQPLDEHFATVTGHFHLERTAAGGGNADGHFLLVFEKTRDGWKIVRDDTTVPPKKACD
jgi:ketosteroid isomerase-like protein